MTGMKLTVTSRIGAINFKGTTMRNTINEVKTEETWAINAIEAAAHNRSIEFRYKFHAALESNEHYDPHIDTAKGECICGEIDCPDEYSHWTSGY